MKPFKFTHEQFQGIAPDMGKHLTQKEEDGMMLIYHGEEHIGTYNPETCEFHTDIEQLDCLLISEGELWVL